MDKKASRGSTKSDLKPKASLRKVTVRDLAPRKGAAAKGGGVSAIRGTSRCA